uniref:Putative ribonuclease H-like domain-containing protein n=1 Tax=Tanacetum cinerariifolium TaxID=118510 RepID=A0A6L2LXT1_TANCI|nr:putative ribonuclease H-like domain-containing protein [Tanacetum cinerariifolium]
MSLDDLYNHLKVYESEVQKKLEPNSQNMAFISSAKHSSGNEEVSTASVSTTSTNVPTASANIGVANISQDTACAYIASQSSGSQIKFEDINQIDKDGMEEMDIKWNMALLNMRADRFWKKTKKNIRIQGTDVAGFDKLKVECLNCHKMGHFARECRAPRSHDRGRRDNYRQGSKVKEQTPKALIVIDGVGWDWSYMDNDEENHALIADEETPTEFALMAKTNAESEIFDNSLCSKASLAQVESRLAEHKSRELKYCEKIRVLEFKIESSADSSKDLDSLLESQRLDKNKERLGYSDVPPPPAQIYSLSKKDMSWTGLPECVDDTENDNLTKSKTDKVATAKKPPPVNTKFSTADMGKKRNAVKALACWIWKPSHNTTNKGPNSNSVSVMFKKYTYIDTQGRLKHMTGNISYFSDYEPFDGGYVSFGQGRCKITGKETIKTGKLEFENVYFIKDLKYNLFSVSQICDNKNSVLFTDSECIVLGRAFKLLDDANVLLRTPRQHNMYSIDLNNIILHKDLNCLVTNASADKGMLWHRRLVTDDFSRFTWTFFLKTKDATSGILRKFITEIENLKDLKVKIIRTLIEAARTMLADVKLPVTFWAKAVNTACYFQNRVLVNKSQNKTPYELFDGRTPAIGFLKPFGYHFEVKGDEGYFIGYSMSSKAFRVFNKRTKKVEENLHVEFLENKAIEKGAGLNWLFDIDSLTKPINYVPVVVVGTNSTNFSGTKDAASQVKKDVSSLRYIALPNSVHDALLETSSNEPQDDCSTDVLESSGNSNPTATLTNPSADQMETLTVETPIPTVSSPVPTACFTDSQEPSSNTRLISKRVANQVETPSMDNILTLTNRFEDILGVTINSDESNGMEVDVSNRETSITASPTPTLKIHKDHPKSQIIGPADTPIQTRNKSKELCKEFEALMHEKFQMSAMGELNFFLGLQVLQKEDGIFLSQDKHQVTPKECHLHAVKMIFRYLKGHLKLGLWCHKESPFDLVAYSDSDYGGATQDCKSTTGGCQFLGRRLISWQCKKQTIVATSITKAEYIAAASCCRQVLWI